MDGNYGINDGPRRSQTKKKKKPRTARKSSIFAGLLYVLYPFGLRDFCFVEKMGHTTKCLCLASEVLVSQGLFLEGVIEGSLAH
jgi:hypothetical protein